MHGDIKPANIHRAADGHVTLLDLGLARRAGEGHDFGERPVAGTLAYLPPEALTSSGTVDIRGEIYSLGVVLYELLAGRLPLDDIDPARLAKLKQTAAPRPLEEMAPQTPGDVAALVHQCLARQPLRRPQSPQELVDGLARLEIKYFGE
jgi:serine/threonine-protein kinase